MLFCGSGSTGAIDKLVGILNLRIPADLDDRYGLSSHIPEDERPVVFIGPFEHHSNELPWRESIADVVVIEEDSDGHVNLARLEENLIRYRDRPLRIGSFSAASNVTGILSDTRAIAALLHRHGALSFWDFAAAAPYVDIDMGGRTATRDPYKDAVFISPHKFVGGPATPGVLVVRRELVRNRVPTVPGGGTVAYVNPSEHRYLDDPVQREEGGTPAIVEAIRAGLVFQLKQAVGRDAIREREDSFIRRAIESWSANPNIELLGNTKAERLSIISFVVRHDGQYLHHNFVVALLNDLFGIQSRGGCSCAGPVRAPAARHRRRALPPVRAGDPAGVRGHQAGLGAGQLQLLHLRGGVRVRARGRPPGGHRGMAAAARLPLRHPHRHLAPPPGAARAAAATVRRRLRRRRQAELPGVARPCARERPGRLPRRGPGPAGFAGGAAARRRPARRSATW